MAIVNRSLDASEQRKTLKVTAVAIATGATGLIGIVPNACTLDGLQMAAFGISGSPTAVVHVHRFIVGTGFTSWAVSGIEPQFAYGTSGVNARGMSLLASGSTLLNLLPNDCLMYLTAGSNAGCAFFSIAAVMKPLQDIKTHFGISGI